MINAHFADAQTEKPTERAFKSFQSSFHLQADFKTRSGGNFFVQKQSLWAFSEDARAYNPDNAVLTSIALRAGYEFPLGKSVVGGMQGKVSKTGNLTEYALRPYVLHYGKIGKLQFGQRLLYQYLKRESGLRKDGSDLNILCFLAHQFEQEKFPLQLSIAFEVGKDLTRLQKGTERRYFAFSAWSFLAEYAPHSNFSFGFFSQFASNYFFALALYDENGKEIKPDRKLNLNEVRTGLVLRYRLSKVGNGEKDFPYSLIF